MGELVSPTRYSLSRPQATCCQLGTPDSLGDQVWFLCASSLPLWGISNWSQLPSPLLLHSCPCVAPLPVAPKQLSPLLYLLSSLSVPCGLLLCCLPFSLLFLSLIPCSFPLAFPFHFLFFDFGHHLDFFSIYPPKPSLPPRC